MKVRFVFSNIDNSLYTPHECSVVMDVQADDNATAVHLAEHLQRVLGADSYSFEGTVNAN